MELIRAYFQKITIDPESFTARVNVLIEKFYEENKDMSLYEIERLLEPYLTEEFNYLLPEGCCFEVDSSSSKYFSWGIIDRYGARINIHNIFHVNLAEIPVKKTSNIKYNNPGVFTTITDETIYDGGYRIPWK